jgi:CheY-like chemotaxis protein
MSQPPTILLVEDSLDDIELIKCGFAESRLPLVTQFATDGLSATEYLLGKGKFADRVAFPIPKVLLTDLHMHRMDGFELIQWVRRTREFPTLPIIVLTGSDETADRQRALALGANAFVTKGLLVHPPPDLIESILRYANGAPRFQPDPDEARRRRRRALE